MFIKQKEIGLNNIFLNIFEINLIGIITTYFIHFFITVIINKLTLINTLLNINKYKEKPDIIPIKIYSLNSPLLNLNTQNRIKIPVIIQNIKSCKYVIISDVLKAFLKILKQSKNIPIKKPVNIKIKKIYN